MITIEYSGYKDKSGNIKNEFVTKIYDDYCITDFSNEFGCYVSNVISDKLHSGDIFYIRTIDKDGNILSVEKNIFDNCSKGVIYYNNDL